MIFGFREFREIRDYIYARTGVHIGDQKVYLLKRRVEERLKALGLSTAEEYIAYLKCRDGSGKEFEELISSVTVNETYFFREFPQLQTFAEWCLPEIAETRKSGRIRILSAGCSTGEEPYTLSIICQEMLDPPHNFSITAVDIDYRALEKARQGIYDERSVRDVPRVYLEKYFVNTGKGFMVKDEVRRFVTFHKVNLNDQRALLALGRDFDFIFCRNVLIYFSDDSRKQVVEAFYAMMNPGGYIFLGHSESLSRITSAFELRRMGESLVYRKPLKELVREW
ncbi:MAG: protein-glutamate O-methyltransferase CheR [Candidatus Caldatribacterium sp.]|nr:protein-glutamate O-methyltransferase CheR [Candidatus Caldatribacterium sp.]